MPKSASEIRMDYNNANRQANSLDQIARELKNIANRNMQDCISDLSHNWTGSNANAYTAKCRQLKENVRRSADRLESTADTIRRIAQNTYRAEMTALEIARSRDY